MSNYSFNIPSQLPCYSLYIVPHDVAPLKEKVKKKFFCIFLLHNLLSLKQSGLYLLLYLNCTPCLGFTLKSPAILSCSCVFNIYWQVHKLCSFDLRCVCLTSIVRPGGSRNNPSQFPFSFCYSKKTKRQFYHRNSLRH